MSRRRASRWRVIVGSILIVLVLAAIAYAALGYFIYTSLADVTTGCEIVRGNRPDQFELVQNPKFAPWPDLDVTPYFMPNYQPVTFPSRQNTLELSGWYVPGDSGAPVVIVLDGVNSCKYAQGALIPAGMLHRNGFNVLLLDPRDMGDSELEDGYSAIGNEEYQDVLGAWDWLVAENGFAPRNIRTCSAHGIGW